jgi:tRNA pseudouridine synthase 10
LADARSVAQLKEYGLCRRCLARQGGRGGGRQDCYICRGLFDGLDRIAKQALTATEPYEFSTFLVGTTLPTQLYEREDALRSRLRIRGRESIKSQFTRELGGRLAGLTGKKVDYLKPDVTVNVLVDREGGVEATARARALAVEGRYVKKERGLPQKQEKCPMCLGRGCNLCEMTGLAGQQSVEGMIAKHLVKATGGQAPRFSWIGSEDQNSLVLGRGRPFYARVADPHTRRPRMKFAEAGVEARITAVMDEMPDTQARFSVRTKIAIKCARQVGQDDVKKLRSLAGKEVKFASKAKLASKKIYSAQAKKTGDDTLELVIKAAGGLPIKQFVGGEEYMEPSVSSLLGARCECVTFDVLAVDFQ